MVGGVAVWLLSGANDHLKYIVFVDDLAADESQDALGGVILGCPRVENVLRENGEVSKLSERRLSPKKPGVFSARSNQGARAR